MFGCDGISDHASWNEVFHYWDTKLSRPTRDKLSITIATLVIATVPMATACKKACKKLHIGAQKGLLIRLTPFEMTLAFIFL